MSRLICRKIITEYLCSFRLSVIENFNFILPSSKSVHNEEKIKQLVEMYQCDLYCSMIAAVNEIKIWQQKFTGIKYLPKNAIDALQNCNMSIFPSIFKLLQILATLPSGELAVYTIRRGQLLVKAQLTKFQTYINNVDVENKVSINLGRDYGAKFKLSIPASHAQVGGPVIRMKPLELPTFSGKFEEWSTFKDLFSSMVHTNPTIVDEQKCVYLRMYLCGDALALIQNLATTGDNYAIAWKTVVERYDNKQPIQKESSTCLRQFTADLNMNMQALNALGHDPYAWGALLLHVILVKLDYNTILKIYSITTASSERSFSTLKRLKTYIRNTTCENRLNGLAMMNIHSDIMIYPDDVLNKLATKIRRLRLILRNDILNINVLTSTSYFDANVYNNELTKKEYE
ncbi:Integrase catalytic domain-containing protein [Aphis craccivora]|uniref:Integrase catalytic domain-containing protein n=1 Tax=Aphis craccivora TaxID=307492 RepID=A0A6G0XET6_APHCR|nr:Integrase catalytic domain-containing protein [Aphis craccivora]